MPVGCGGETTRARTCGLRAFAGATSTDFSLSDLRFIVAVCGFLGFKVRVFASLMMNAPIEFPDLRRLGRHRAGVESKLTALLTKALTVVKLRHKGAPRRPSNADSRSDLDTFPAACG
jgi:hypothetical protein